MPTKKTDNNPQTPGSPPHRRSNRTRGKEPATVEPDPVDVSSLGKPRGAAKGQRPSSNLKGPASRKPAKSPDVNCGGLRPATGGKGQRPTPQTSPGTADPEHATTARSKRLH